MDKLLDGIINFKNKDFKDHEKLFADLKNIQKPHTLFITCSDSRIDPNMITGSLPGELFIIRNVANIIPPNRETSDYVATTSAVEYAVQVLGVENIIVCGHSNCGGCAASLYSMDIINELPHTSKWLELLDNVKEKIMKSNKKEAWEWMLEQANVVEQINNLKTYPFISERIKDKTLSVSGWYYIIETGEVYIFDNETKAFMLSN
ncbi:MAG: carbonic anhydrase [Firmicutes bacterium]|nr:carbonic anhydrase [Bacillota bacterium]